MASLCLRDLRVDWQSVEADPEAAFAVQAVVGGEVRTLEGVRTGFAPDTFDLVVVVDMLEHVENDSGLVEELAEIVRDGGTLVVNVPRITPGSPIPTLRRWVELTDERHGHVRPGNTEQDTEQLLRPRFVPEATGSYSHVLLNSLDLVLNAGRLWMGRLRGRGPPPKSRKGALVTRPELGRNSLPFRVLKLLSPLLEDLARMDRRLNRKRGHRLVIRARRASRRPTRIQR